MEYDAAGRMAVLRQNQSQILSQQWRKDGQLASVSYETTALYREYREDGVFTKLIVTAPDEEAQARRWLDVGYDELGRTEKVTDHAQSDG